LRYGLPRPELFAGLAVMSGSLKRVDDLRESLPVGREQLSSLKRGRRRASPRRLWG
jgi:hypothetical protein